ncbi:MAG: branched-chain amino acid ABC transporter permease, partial [Candidatus Marsarchaeota archaeon]|nr:branched-chain amino acid ABC transporter permease [Candidatus Marsarchaeota archaeon]
MNYVWHLLIMVGIYTLLGISLNLVVGYTGILSFMHGLLYGIGAYVTAILATKLGVGFIGGIIAGLVVALVAGMLAMRMLQRLRDDYLILGFFGIQLAGIGIIHNWVAVTDGPFGVYNIPKPAIASFTFSGYPEFLILVFALVAAAYFVSIRLIHSPFGIALKCIREDEIAAQALGKNVGRYKRTVFGIAGAIASTAGALYATYSSYIHPSNFGLDISILLFALVVIGGLGTQAGPLVGALLVVLMP